MNKKEINILLIIVVFALSFFQVTHRLGEEQIKIWDESSAARNAVEMLHSEIYLYANIEGEPDYYDVKPPLQLWLKVLSFKMLGINEFAVRFPTLMSYFLLLLLMFFFAVRYLKSIRLGILLVIFPAVSLGFVNYHMAWHGDTDILLTLSTTLYILIAFLFIQEFPQKKLKYAMALGLLVFTAYFIKSIAGLAPALGIVIYIVIKKRSVFKDFISYIPTLFFVGAFVSYYLLVENSAPGYISSVLENHLMPFKEYPSTPKHPEFSFYFNYLSKTALYPFFYLLPLAIIPLVFSKNQWIKNFLLYLIIVAASFLIGQSSALMKNEWYIAPIYPLLWLIISVSIYETYHLFKDKFYQKSNFYKAIPIIFMVVMLYGFGRYYISIYERNDDRNGTYIYPPERDGDFLRKVVFWNENIDNILILRSARGMSERQLDFYVKKFRYFENKDIMISTEVNDTIIGKYVLCTDPELIEKVNQEYKSLIVYKEKYGVLLYVIEKKKTDSNSPEGAINMKLLDIVSKDIKEDKELSKQLHKQVRERGHALNVVVYNNARWMILNDSALIKKNAIYNQMDSIRYNSKEYNTLMQKAETENVDIDLVLFEEAKVIVEQRTN